MSIKCNIGVHKWKGCKCSSCGKMRNEQHLWDGCVCIECGKNRDAYHSWKGHKCSRCGKTKTIQDALELFNKEKYKESIETLELIEETESKSAYYYFLLGCSNVQYGNQNFEDNESLAPWITRGVDALNKSINIDQEFGGLTEKQREFASDAALHGERIIEQFSPTIQYEQRVKIYREYKETEATERNNVYNLKFSNGGAVNAGFSEWGNALQNWELTAKETAVKKIMKEYSLTKGQLYAILYEGNEKKW